MKLSNIALGTPISYVFLVMYMASPATAAFIVQKLNRQSLSELGIKFDLSKIKWYLVTIVLFVALSVLTLGSIWFFGNVLGVKEFGLLDFSQGGFVERIQTLISQYATVKGNDVQEIASITPIGMAVLVIISGISDGFSINGLVAFGEELGWRGLMLTETKNMGFWGSSLFIGLIWGLWHAPIIAMGHNYPKHPILGIFWMCLFTVAVSPIFAYVRLKAGSIIAPSALHGMINATGAMYVLLIASANELFSSIVGIASVIASVVITIAIVTLDKKFVKNYRAYFN